MTFSTKPSDELLFAVEALNRDGRFQILVNALRKEDADLSVQSVQLTEIPMIYRNQGKRTNIKELLELIDCCSEWIEKRRSSRGKQAT